VGTRDRSRADYKDVGGGELWTFVELARSRGCWSFKSQGACAVALRGLRNIVDASLGSGPRSVLRDAWQIA